MSTGSGRGAVPRARDAGLSGETPLIAVRERRSSNRRLGQLPFALLLTACGASAHPHSNVAVAYRLQCTPRDAHVTVDEVDQGACAVWEQQYLGLGTGIHRLRVDREGYLPLERELPSTGRRETLRIELRPMPE